MEKERILSALTGKDTFYIAGIAKDEADVIIKSEKLKPDALIIDLFSSGISKPDLVRFVGRRSPSTLIIVLGNPEEDDLEDELTALLFYAGISGFVCKNEDLDILALITELVFSGRKYISASVVTRLFKMYSFISQFPERPAELNSDFFSPAEYSIVTYLAKGLSDEEIAEDLHLSEGTIKNCLTNIRRKTNMKTRLEIVMFSLIFGLVRLDKASWNDKIDGLFQKKL